MNDGIFARFAIAQVGVSGAYYHQQPAYSGCLACGPSRLGVTERAAPQILSLPIYPQLSDEAVDRVVGEIRAFFR